MVVLVIGASVAAAIGLAWVGFKASVRIEAWGQGLNACDEIIRMAGEHHESQVELRSILGAPPVVASHGIHFGTAGK